MTLYTEKLADEICQRIANCEQLQKICVSEEMPDRTTIWSWTKKHPDFAIKYREAWEMQADLLLDKCTEIADDTSNDVLFDVKGNPTPNMVAVQRAKTQINILQWRIERISPRKYLAENLIEKKTADNLVPINITIERDTFDPAKHKPAKYPA